MWRVELEVVASTSRPGALGLRMPDGGLFDEIRRALSAAGFKAGDQVVIVPARPSGAIGSSAAARLDEARAAMQLAADPARSREERLQAYRIAQRGLAFVAEFCTALSMDAVRLRAELEEES